MGKCSLPSLGRPPEDRTPSPAGLAFFMKGAYEGCAVDQIYSSWVPDAVRQECDRVCRQGSPYSALEIQAATRLVSDSRMSDFYGSTRLNWSRGRNVDIAWRLWFQVALSAIGVDETGLREATERQRQNVSRLAQILGEARHLLMEIEQEQEHAPVSIPLEFTDILYLIEAAATRGEIVGPYDRARYEQSARPCLDEIFRFSSSAACFIPSVPHVLAALERVAADLNREMENRQTIPWSGTHSADWLASQKEGGEIRTYVRTVDRNMWEVRWEYTDANGEECWRLPDTMLALQCKVALGLPDLEGFVDRVRKGRIKPEDL